MRAIALEQNLPNANEKDSQGICFLGDMNISRFLEHYIEDKPGKIVNPEGKVLGSHRGLHRYTTGQRRGIGVPSNTDNEFYVVTGLNMERNELIVAFDQFDSPGLYTSEVEVYDVSFLNRPVTESCRLLAKPRYRDPSQSITYTPIDKIVQSDFDKPQRALSPDRFSLYEGDQLLGGGFYNNILVRPSTIAAKASFRINERHNF